MTGVLGGNSQLIICVPLLLPYLRHVSAIMSEKDARIKEGMKIMGLTGSIFYLSWTITYTIIYGIISILSAAILQAGILKLSGYFYIFLWYYLICLASMGLGTLVTVFFSNPKVASILSFVVFFMSTWPSNYVVYPNVTADTKFWASFAPATSVLLSSIQIFDLEAASIGVTSSNIDLLYENYKLSWHYICSTIVCIVCLTLTFYLDQIIPV